MKTLTTAIAFAVWGAFAAAQTDCVCLKCVLPIYENFIMSSSAMSPAFEGGDCAVASRFFPADGPLERGDVIVFVHPTNQSDYIFRVIGLPGDTVQMRDGKVVLNGAPLPQRAQSPLIRKMERDPVSGTLPRCPAPTPIGQTCEIPRITETLPSGRSYDVLDIAGSPSDNTPLFNVPDAHVFVMGDNRDNALDSRFPRVAAGPGFVPIANVTGVFEEE